MKIYHIVRVLLGILLVFTGLNGFFNFTTAGFEGLAMDFIELAKETGYMIYFLKSIELLIGLSFIFNKFTKLSSIALVPITINVMLFHIFLAQSSIWLGMILLAGNTYMVYYFRKKYLCLI